jgi:hypothetical protein
MARFDLVEIAVKENDTPTRTNLLRELTFDVERKGATVEPCTSAARQYTQLTFQSGDFDEGIKAFLTTCGETELIIHLMHPSLGRLPYIVDELTSSMDEPTKKRGEKLADAANGWLKTQAGNWLKDAKTKPLALEAWSGQAEGHLRGDADLAGT